MELHVGRGTTHGPLTVFPLWKSGTRAGGYTTDASQLEAAESAGGPQVSTLVVCNTGDQPVLVLEGQLFEGGWQHRMARHSTLIAPAVRVAIEVACVEQGRWGGEARQHSRGRRATPYVRDSVRHQSDVQQTVWARVARHTDDSRNTTSSLVRHLDAHSDGQPAFRPMAGQVGVLVGLGGQPYVAEVFESPSILRRQFDAITQAAGLDARFAPAEATPGRRARRFVERYAVGELSIDGVAGLAERLVGRSAYVDVATVRWNGRDIHTRITNVRHPLLADVR